MTLCCPEQQTHITTRIVF